MKRQPLVILVPILVSPLMAAAQDVFDPKTVKVNKGKTISTLRSIPGSPFMLIEAPEDFWADIAYTNKKTKKTDYKRQLVKKGTLIKVLREECDTTVRNGQEYGAHWAVAVIPCFNGLLVKIKIWLPKCKIKIKTEWRTEWKTEWKERVVTKEVVREVPKEVVREVIREVPVVRERVVFGSEERAPQSGGTITRSEQERAHAGIFSQQCCEEETPVQTGPKPGHPPANPGSPGPPPQGGTPRNNPEYPDGFGN